jgi:hypothetical protein
MVTALTEVSQTGTIIIDLTAPHEFGEEQDDAIWNIAGPAPEADAYVDRVLHKVVHSKVDRKNCRVMGGTADLRELFALTKFELLPQADTLEQLLKETGPVEIAPQLAKVLAAAGGLGKMVGQLTEAGLFSGKIMTGSQPAVYAALTLLGE